MVSTSGVDAKQTIEALEAAEVAAYRAAIASARLRLAKADAHEHECNLSEEDAHADNIEARKDVRRAKAALDALLAKAPTGAVPAGEEAETDG